jgi:glucose-6-phosphate 1-dehydrogenase
MYISADVTDPGDLSRVLAACEGAPALYFALPPAITARACAALGALDRPAGLTLALEKPFGTDRRSAVALNKLLATLALEERIHRIDHFLGRSTVLNLIGLRASPTASWSRSGTATTSSASISCTTRRWDWRTAPVTTTTPAPWSI